eukprot:TRINITY_DN14692_c0_g1_i2.p1 TRINITY_DN14692_c0_g1~~TRINITY_DN14692_c0_g1_i2.p1  ORF type:complete len:106 (-),score=23.32 TRINITY_DN14692_c0_g1_i2:131-448(-)
MPPAAEKRYKTLAEFYPFYLKEHSNTVNRRLHFVGTLLGHIFLIYFISQAQYARIPLAFLPGYACAWIGHFIFEKNKPATFKYPLLSLMSDFKLFYSIILGKHRL